MTTIPFQPTSKASPFGTDHKLLNVVSIQYRLSHLKEDADARELQLQPGDQVIVDSERGPVIASVTGQVARKLIPRGSLPRVLRKASNFDLSQAEKNEEVERQAYRFAIERIRTRKLPMKLVRTQSMQDSSKLVFYFSADGRIDFRDLVKDLAHRFRTRIEMFQIGVRDGTRMLGGIGPCGRELCCSTFLENFEPISIRMAKDQGLTLNPRKISGMCGRLMCCLVYEQKIYRKMRSRLPRTGKSVLTEFGEGTVQSVDVINQRVWVSFPSEQNQLLPLDQVEVLHPNQVNKTVDGSDSEDARASDEEPILKNQRSRRRSTNRRRRKKSSKDTSSEE